jgi:4-hydroxybenzoate polyprenyltransferase
MKILDYIFFTRPVLFPPVWTIVILGVRAADVGHGASPFETLGLGGVDQRFLLFMLAVTCVFGGVYTFNQIHDIESDRRNSKLFFLAEGMISIPVAYIITAILDIVALVCGYRLGRGIEILFAAVVLFGILYSHPLTNFKGRASKGYWTNSFGHGMVAFLIGWGLYNGITLEAAVTSLPYIFGVGAIYLNTTLPDAKGDAEAGKITHGVRWGPKKTTQASFFLVLLSCVFAQMVGDFAFLIAGVVSLPFFFVAYRTTRMPDVIRSTKVAVLALTVFACIYLPPYTVLLVVGFLISRWYFRSRFDISYPSLT